MSDFCPACGDFARCFCDVDALFIESLIDGPMIVVEHFLFKDKNFDDDSVARLIILRALYVHRDALLAVRLAKSLDRSQASEQDAGLRYVSKFNPGAHFYALRKKFHSLEAARRHLEERGYRYGGLKTDSFRPRVHGD